MHSLDGVVQWLSAKLLDKPGIILGSGACALVGLVVFRRHAQTRKLPPGSMGIPIVGETMAFAKDPKSFFMHRLNKYGGTFKTSVLFSPTVVLAPSTTNAKCFYSERNCGFPSHWLKLVGRSSLAMVDGAIHKRMRVLNGRALTDDQLDAYLVTIQELTAKHLQQWVADVPKLKSKCDLHANMKLYAFDLFQEVLLGVHMPTHTTKLFMELFETAVGGLDCIIPLELPGFYWKKAMAARHELVKEYQKIIEDRRSQLKLEMKPSSMLDTMLHIEDISDTELQDSFVNIMFAGRDTVACFLQSLLYWLKQVPEQESQLREQVHKAWNGKSPITRKILQHITKVRAFVKEVLRIAHPVHFAMRKLTDGKVIDGFKVPKGWTLLMPIAAFNTKCEHPEEFNLARHLDDMGNFIDSTSDIDSFATFGGGARMCIGYKFAMDEMLIFMLQLLRSMDFRIYNPKQLKFVFNYWSVEAGFWKIPNSAA